MHWNTNVQWTECIAVHIMRYWAWISQIRGNYRDSMGFGLFCSLVDPSYCWSLLRVQWVNKAGFGWKIMHTNSSEITYTFDYLKWQRQRVSSTDKSYLLSYYLHSIRVRVLSGNKAWRWWWNGGIGRILARWSNNVSLFRIVKSSQSILMFFKFAYISIN